MHKSRLPVTNTTSLSKVVTTFCIAQGFISICGIDKLPRQDYIKVATYKVTLKTNWAGEDDEEDKTRALEPLNCGGGWCPFGFLTTMEVGMLRYRLVKWTRQIRIFFGGGKEMEQKHYLFTLPKPLRPEEIWEKLWVSGWGYNSLSTTYRGQIYTMRKLVPPRHQYHIRFYENGNVSGHFEVDNLQFPLEHLDGVDLRRLNDEEIAKLKAELAVQ